MGVKMKYVAMHSKTKVKAVSEVDGSGQLLYSCLNIHEQNLEIAELTREEVEYMIYVVCTP